MVWDGIERRVSPRMVIPCQVSITHSGKMISTTTKNISNGGIGVSLNESLPVKADVKLEIRSSEKIIKCDARILWVLHQRDKANPSKIIFDTGIQFRGLNNESKQVISSLVKECNSNSATYKHEDTK